jgi:hypothetical protein
MSWPYTQREDGKIAVTIDNNVWNFLFDRRMNLASELPSAKFALFVPREVEIESLAIKDTNEYKGKLIDYIRKTLTDRNINITTTSTFGFAEMSAGGPQRVGGFGGTFQSQIEHEFYELISGQFLLGKKKKGSELTADEADAAVAVQSSFSVVLTCERPNKKGPLRVAAEHGGKVLYLAKFDQSGVSLKEYIEKCYQQTRTSRASRTLTTRKQNQA